MVRNAKLFEFTSYALDDTKSKCTFNYSVILDDEVKTFTETLLLPQPIDTHKQNSPVLISILQALHLILGISYYKLYCPRDIKIAVHTLSKEQADFWNTVYTKGLGEFFYKNNIDFRGLVNFPYDETVQNESTHNNINAEKKRALVAFGGGKDSIVTAEILKSHGIECAAFMLEPQKIQEEAVALVGFPTIEIERILDSQLFILNASDEVYNGHIPISVVYGFTALLSAFLYDYTHVVFSNEKSANYGNVDYLGQTVNHQWSKSEEYELLCSSYINKYITNGIFYFSLLRPLYEIEVVRRFADLKQYHHVFSSCNKNFKIQDPLTETRWCGNCPKCAFVFCLMSAFTAKNELIAIFGKNLYEDESLIDMYKQLLGIAEFKPFDCVGTPDETCVAMHIAHEQGEYNETSVMKLFGSRVLPNMKDIDAMKSEVFKTYESKNIPDEFQNMIAA